MRIRLTLQPEQGGRTAVPVNYQYPLSAALYRILREVTPAYADFLHQRGYAAPTGRLMKLFTFSKLWIPDVEIRGRILSGSARPWKLQIGSPFQHDFVQNVVHGLFLSKTISLSGAGVRAHFVVTAIDILPTPEFRPEMDFRCLSPVVVSTMRPFRGKLQTRYLTPDDPHYSERLYKNLTQKYEILFGNAPQADAFDFRLRKGNTPRSRLITIKEGTVEATQIRAYEMHFTLKGDPGLMKVAWECGLGEHNSQGFGMIEPLVPRGSAGSEKTNSA